MDFAEVSHNLSHYAFKTDVKEPPTVTLTFKDESDMYRFAYAIRQEFMRMNSALGTPSAVVTTFTMNGVKYDLRHKGQSNTSAWRHSMNRPLRDT